ncbi:Zinc finger protein 532 [Habropoda laboriosa]|uniref:Zinc finger protein 532 n=1 Tax=Habropoda laboriosa TaxID=597456 RepID=A0A0L7RE64_9HYME|nr:Zinc finger protein 532 [Habropoda laboriosa]
MPKLRKNRRIGTRWGLKYYTAVKNAVFITQALPYVPREPPPIVKEYVPQCETLYMCAQCKDRFYFRSSLEDHIARKSWILGYWCQQCFVTVCRHSPTEGSLCSTCMQSNREKRLYLRSRGLRKRQKFGVVRIFYNQCQFFAHLKTHNVDLVDMGDLMLMPLPTNINHDWSPEVDLICEAFMEHTFVMKVHIMDWLKHKNIDKNWWQLASTKEEYIDNSVTHIIKSYKGRFYFNSLEIPMDEQFSTLNSFHSTSNNSSMYSDIEILDSVENVDKRTSSSSIDTTTSISDESVIENEDSPCTVNDIAFVDCGPTTKYFEPKTPLNNNKKKCTTASVKAVKDSFTVFRPSKVITSKLKRNRTAHLNRISSNMIITTPIKVVTESNIVKVESDKNISKPNLLIIEPLSKTQSDRSCATKMDICKTKLDKLKQNVHTLTVNSGQKVVTFQSTKHVNIDTIINQLPPHIINSKKIVFIGQDSDTIGVHSKQESPSKTAVPLVPDENEKLLETKKGPEIQKVLSRANKNSNKNVSKNHVETIKNKTRSFTNKVIYQNGRKYIIKQSSGTTKHSKMQSKSTNSIPPLIPLNPVDIENISNQERMNSLHGDVSPLTPSPSPSELSSSSSCDVQSKQPSSLIKSSQKVDVAYLTGVHRDIGVTMHNTKSSFESLSFHKGEDENLYLDVKFLNQKPIYTIVDTSTMITKCKQEMVNEFFHLSYPELQKRYEHLQQIGEEILKVMNFVTDNVIKENLKAVNILQTVLKHCIDKCIDKTDDTIEKDVQLNEWESEYQRTDEKSTCKACNKITKPKYYIPGFSKPAKNDNYCSCYRHVCHKCHTYQGNSTRFVSHQTFHDKEKPYLCPDCYRKFTTFRSLELHTWTTCFHTLKKRALGCKICEVDGFQDMESVARHFAIMHSHNKIACDKCYIVLPSYSEYRKHHKDKHPDSDDCHPIRLVLCKLGRCIVRCEEYMLHMEKHLVVQRLIWFKCPFCTFIHVETKRIMSHLQTGHMARLKELISSEVLRNVLQVETAANLSTNNAQQDDKFTNADARSCEDGTVMPKIINTRTITSEVFESGAQESEDYLVNYDAQQSPKVVVKVKSEPSTDSKKTLLKILDVRSIANLTSNNSKCKSEQNRKAKQAKSSKKMTLGKIEVVEIQSKDTDESACCSKAIKSEPDTLSVDSLQQESFLKIKEEQNEGEILEKEVLAKIEKMETENAIDLWNSMQIQEQIEGVQRTPFSRPPPLARIPQCESFELNRSKKVAHPAKGGKTTVLSRGQKTNRELPQRIALNDSDNSEEIFNFSCNWCGELINTSKSIISNHFQRKHLQDCKLSTLTTDLLRMSPDFINGGYKDLLGNRKRKSDSIASNSKRRRRWNPKKYSDGKNASFTGVGLCVKQETAKDSEGNFRCKKCDQRCSDMADLREHIASNHRIRGRYLVCLECGDNFVVVPSLQMHLKAFHGIEDPITYMTQNTSYAPDNVDQLETAGKSIEANQCHVCMAVFEDKAAVDKHLRVHGMAFLNRKRIEAQNALKSPEKKSESEEEKRTPVKTSPKEPVRKDKPAETILEKITVSITFSSTLNIIFLILYHIPCMLFQATI